MAKIITLTMNPALDKSAHIDRVVPDRKLRCTSPRHEPGGGGINVSRAIRRLGGESLALYTSGGPIGAMVTTLLEQEGVNQRAIAIEGLTRENLTVFEESSGHQFRLGMPGPTLPEAEWQQCLTELKEAIAQAEYVVASGSLPPNVPTDFYARVARMARRCDCRFIVDTAGDALRAAAQEGVYLLKPNMRELRQLAERDLEKEAEQEAAAEDLIRQQQAQVVVVSLGAAGALLVTKDMKKRLRAPTVPIRSKIGAGDSMIAGIVLGLERGNPLQQAVLFGVAAGAAAVMTPGTELCRREDTERLYAQIMAEYE